MLWRPRGQAFCVAGVAFGGACWEGGTLGFAQRCMLKREFPIRWEEIAVAPLVSPLDRCDHFFMKIDAAGRSASLALLVVLAGCTRLLSGAPAERGDREPSALHPDRGALAELRTPLPEWGPTGTEGAPPVDSSGGLEAQADAGAGGEAGAGVAHAAYALLETGSRSFLQPLGLDVTLRSLGATGPAVPLDKIGGTASRCLVALADGRLLVGDGYRAQLELWRPGAAVTSLVALDHGDAAPEDLVTNVHGACQLADGRLLLGEYGMGNGNAVSLYEFAGSGARFVRSVFHTTLSQGVLASCHQVGSELMLSIVNATDDGDGDIVRLAQQGAAWVETGRFDTSTFGGPTPIYAFVPTTRGAFLFPTHRFGGRLDTLMLCQVDDLSATGCSPFGALPKSGSANLWGADVLFAASAVPGAEDLLFSTNGELYRYRVAERRFESLLIYADQGLPLGYGGGTGQVRGLVVVRP